MVAPTNHRWLELTRYVRGEFRQQRHDPDSTFDFLPETNQAARAARASRSSCQAARMRPGTPPKKIPDRSTFVSRMTR